MSGTMSQEFRHSPEFALSEAATRLFGAEWSRPLAQLTGVNLRTCQRVAAAIAKGHADPRADTLRTLLRDRLSEVAAGLADVRDSLTFQLALSDDDTDPIEPLEKPYLAHLQERCDAAAAKGGGAITLWAEDLRQVLELGRDAENLATLAIRAALTLNNHPTDPVRLKAARAAVGEAAERFQTLPVLLDGSAMHLLRDFEYDFPAYNALMSDAPAGDDDRLIWVDCEDERAVADLASWVEARPWADVLGRLTQWEEVPETDYTFSVLVSFRSGLNFIELIAELEDAVNCSAVPIARSLSERGALSGTIWTL